MNIIVYHIYCVNDYLEVVKQQVDRVLNSGLYDWCDLLEVTCVDNNGKFDGIYNIFKDLNKVNIFKTTENNYEYWAIKRTWELSQKLQGKLFYFHTKGVSNRYNNLIQKNISEWKSKGVDTWKECLEYFLIDNFKECISKLDQFDTVGVTCNNGWYSGNFWWANLDYIKQNPEPCFAGRWYYENWLNDNRKYSNYEFFHFDFNGYFSYFPTYVFKTDRNLNHFECKLTDAYYGSIEIQQDEGYEILDNPKIVEVTQEVRDLITINKTTFVVDNAYFGDPAYMQRKYLIINFKINNDMCKVVFNEGWKCDISFLKV